MGLSLDFRLSLGLRMIHIVMLERIDRKFKKLEHTPLGPLTTYQILKYRHLHDRLSKEIPLNREYLLHNVTSFNFSSLERLFSLHSVFDGHVKDHFGHHHLDFVPSLRNIRDPFAACVTKWWFVYKTVKGVRAKDHPQTSRKIRTMSFALRRMR